ncbi:MAG: transposase [Fulvivirga sp.]
MEPGQTYHIFNHANGNENLFVEPDNYRYFLELYQKHIHPAVDTFAYVLMPNHFHFLVRVKETDCLRDAFPKFQTLEKLIDGKGDKSQLDNFISKQFANFFSAYTQSFNKHYNRRGSLFMKNFKRKPVVSDEQWRDTFLYIHHNPIKHGFSKNIESWQWSSWHAYKKMYAKTLIDRNIALSYFDDLENLIYCSEEKVKFILSMELE